MLEARIIWASDLENITALTWVGRPSHRARTGPLADTEGSALPASLPDGLLVSLTLRGIEPAFTLLCKRHARRLRNVVAARLIDQNEVSDVVQETFLALWRALPSYDIQRPFESWLTTIAVNKCRDWARRRAVRFDTLTRFQEEISQGTECSWANPLESGLVEGERDKALQKALARLPDPLREPLVRTALHQASHAVVARELDITVKAVEMRVRRARQRLHSALASA